MPAADHGSPRLVGDPGRRRCRIVEIKSPLILQPGPAALTEGLDAIASAIHSLRGDIDDAG